MGKDYYKILGVPSTASTPDLSQSFRVLALTYHPKRQHSAAQIGHANHTLAEICEAYEVLSNCNPFHYLFVIL
jgi:DnaJ family protein B protein 5